MVIPGASLIRCRPRPMYILPSWPSDPNYMYTCTNDVPREYLYFKFEASANREIEFCRRFGKSRLHVEQYLRELHQFKEMSPTVHIQLLSDYLKIAPCLDISPDHPFSGPTLRHPDFSPSNILINSSNDIVGIIDWQHAMVLPLCLYTGIPTHFQNWGDPLSETLAKPEVKLPENFNDLSQHEQATVQETLRKRLVHFYYTALTMKGDARSL